MQVTVRRGKWLTPIRVGLLVNDKRVADIRADEEVRLPIDASARWLRAISRWSSSRPYDLAGEAMPAALDLRKGWSFGAALPVIVAGITASLIIDIGVIGVDRLPWWQEDLLYGGAVFIAFALHYLIWWRHRFYRFVSFERSRNA